MNRRGFLGRLAGALVSPLLPAVAHPLGVPVYTTLVVGKNALTFTMPMMDSYLYNVYTSDNVGKLSLSENHFLVSPHKKEK